MQWHFTFPHIILREEIFGPGPDSNPVVYTLFVCVWQVWDVCVRQWVSVITAPARLL